MSDITIPALPVAGNGTNTVQEGRTLPAVELQSIIDAIVNTVNGQLDEGNFDAGTQIPSSLLALVEATKVDDYSSNDAQFALVSNPGDSASPNLPTDLSEELRSLRYRIEALGGHRAGTTFRNSAGSDVGTAWVEPPIRGSNLLANSGFEVPPASSGDPPPGWTEVGSIVTSVIENPAFPVAGLEKRSLAITTNAIGEGISQQVGGLKASTKYLFGLRYTRTAGTLAFTVTGGLPSGDYQNCSISDSSSSGVAVTSFIVQSTTNGDPMTFGVVETSGSGDFNPIEAWMFELGDDYPAHPLTFPVQEASVSAEVTNVPATVNSSTDWTTNWTDIPGLELSQYVPTAGYRLIYEVDVSWATALNDTQYAFGFQLELDDGSPSVVDGPIVEHAFGFGEAEPNKASVTRLRYVVDNPTPGITYTFTPQATAAAATSGSHSAPRLHPLVTISAGGSGSSAGSNSTLQTVSTARLRVERI